MNEQPVRTSSPEGLRPLSDVLDDQLVWSLLDAAPDAIVITDEAGRILLVNHQTEEWFGYERTELLGRDIEVLVPDHFRQRHRAHRTRFRAEPRTRPMGAGSELFGRRHDGSEFPVEISLSPLHSPAGLLVMASVRDITARMEAEAERRQIRELLDSTRDAILIFDADTLRFTYVNQGAVEQVGYSRDELTTMTLLHLAPELTPGQLQSLLTPLRRGEASSTTFRTVHRRRDGVDIPVETILQADSSRGDAPTYIALVRDISERVESEERLRQASEELRLLEDRERIARDLHDTVIQRLFAAGMVAQSVSAMVGAVDPKAARRLEGVVDELDETIREIRSTIYALQTRTPGPQGLRQEIVRVVDDERDALGVEPRLRLDGGIDAVPEPIAAHLIPTLREALSNVARHAHATAVEIVVDARDDVVLRVSDDGTGVDASGAQAGGNGLRNMRDRAAALGGSCRVESAPGSGTLVEWRVPNRDG